MVAGAEQCYRCRSDRTRACAYDSEGTLYGDDAPCLDYRRWDLVYRVPIGVNRLDMRRRIRHTILDLFGVWPSEEDVSDASGQRYLYSFETIGGVVNGNDGSKQCNHLPCT